MPVTSPEITLSFRGLQSAEGAIYISLGCEAQDSVVPLNPRGPTARSRADRTINGGLRAFFIKAAL
jgi:hypothetical protein